MADDSKTVLFVGHLVPLEVRCVDGVWPVICDEIASLTEHLGKDRVAAIVIGSDCPPPVAREVISAVAASSCSATIIISGLTSAFAIYNDLGQPNCVCYLSEHPVANSDLAKLISSVTRVRKSDEFNADLSLVTELCDLLPDEADITFAAVRLRRAVRRLTNDANCSIFLNDRESRVIADVLRETSEKHTDSSGVVGYAAHTGCVELLADVTADPRYDATIDNPLGQRNARFLCVPVTDDRGTVRLLIVATRHSEHPSFSASEADCIQALALELRPTLIGMVYLRSLRLQIRKQMYGGRDLYETFREQAVQYHESGAASVGSPLSPVPRYLRQSLLTVVVALVLVICVSIVLDRPVPVLASGLIFSTKHALVLSAGSFTVEAIPVERGSLVAQGQIVAAGEGDAVRAPIAGRLVDFSVEHGMHLVAGQRIGTVADDSEGFDLYGCLNAPTHVDVGPGSSMVVTLHGISREFQHSNVHWLGTSQPRSQEAMASCGQRSNATTIAFKSHINSIPAGQLANDLTEVEGARVAIRFEGRPRSSFLAPLRFAQGFTLR